MGMFVSRTSSGGRQGEKVCGAQGSMPDGTRLSWTLVTNDLPQRGSGNRLEFEPMDGGAVLYAPIPRSRTLLNLDAGELVDHWREAVGRG
jgi:hypothetical protein